MTQVTMIGCDLHDRSMLLQTAVGKQKPEQKSFRNDFLGRKAMMGYLFKGARESGSGRIVFVYEASSQGYGLYDLLTAQGIECFVLSPTHIPRSAKSKRQKTDPKDALKLLELARGHVLAGNELPVVWTPPRLLRHDRELLRGRLEAAETCTRVKLQIFAMLKRHGIELPQWFSKSRSWTKHFVAWLKEEAERMAATVRPVLSCLIERFETLRRQVVALERHIRHLSKTPRYQVPCEELRELTGVGLITAMTFLTEMGDLARFSNRRQVAAYLGVCPASFESGEADDRKGHITRQGPGRVRKVLCQAAWAAIRTDPRTRVTWERIKRGSSRRSKKAVVAIMRRLGIRMWHVALSAGVDTKLKQPPTPPPRWTSARAQQKGPPLSPPHRPGPRPGGEGRGDGEAKGARATHLED